MRNARVKAVSLSPSSASELEPFRFTDEDFRTIASVLHQDAGIFLSDAKASLVYSRLTKRLRALGLRSFRDYCALIKDDAGSGERQKMIASLTTNVTRFFRESHHFDHLRDKIVAPRAASLRAGARLRIWSSACSNGQEPYSIAMMVLSILPNAADLDVRILATDIDQDMVAAGRAGVYGEESMDALSEAQRTRWFAPVDTGGARAWRVREDLAALVAFRELNLIGRWPMKGRFEAIFCRNVMIYFEETTQQTVWSRFVDLLSPGGALYIGHSERVSGAAAARFASDGVTTYRLKKEERL